jgi:hypothetical protein
MQSFRTALGVNYSLKGFNQEIGRQIAFLLIRGSHVERRCHDPQATSIPFVPPSILLSPYPAQG